MTAIVPFITHNFPSRWRSAIELRFCGAKSSSMRTEFATEKSLAIEMVAERPFQIERTDVEREDYLQVENLSAFNEKDFLALKELVFDSEGEIRHCWHLW
jgi:hypothetical protein